MHEDVRVLCDFRDQYLLTNSAGRRFVNFYYKNSPRVADHIRNRPIIKVIIRRLLRPLIRISGLITEQRGLR